MASRINILIGAMIFLLVVLGSSCTKYDYIDGGLAKGVHDCSMWDYFHTDSYDWDSTIVMIEHAGLKSLFDGTGEYKEITFFGLTNHSIRAYMLNNNLNLDEDSPRYLHRVTDISPAKCKDLLEKLVVPKRVMLKDVPRGTRVSITNTYLETNGMTLECLGGTLFLWTVRDEWNQVKDAGAITLSIASHNVKNAKNEVVASTDIQTTNGIVQALNYNFDFKNF
ncbi:hypothetical protein AAAX96_15825 [Butyricimonas faecihominis]|uniref:hypothetical protein n=1 Tax=Butyricimonas faecihominis TaxID=1472416 RepID=UPI0032C0E58E